MNDFTENIKKIRSMSKSEISQKVANRFKKKHNKSPQMAKLKFFMNELLPPGTILVSKDVYEFMKNHPEFKK